MSDDMPTLAIIFAIMFLLIVVAVSLTHCGDDIQNTACGNSPIKDIGGCDKEGYCGVLLENGRYVRRVYQPVVGVLPKEGYCKS